MTIPHYARKLHPARQAVEVTPSDSADIPGGPARGLYVGEAGDVSVLLVNNSAPITLSNLAAGVVHPLEVRRVRATGTTATGIVAFLD